MFTSWFASAGWAVGSVVMDATNPRGAVHGLVGAYMTDAEFAVFAQKVARITEKYATRDAH